MIIYFNKKKVARIDNFELTEATSAFREIWKEFQRDGVPVLTVGGGDREGLKDMVEYSKEVGCFIRHLRHAGYRIKE